MNSSPPARRLEFAVALGPQGRELTLKRSSALGQAFALAAQAGPGVRELVAMAGEFRLQQVAQARCGLLAGDSASFLKRFGQSLIDPEHRQGRSPISDVLGQLLPRRRQLLLALLETPAHLAGRALGAVGVTDRLRIYGDIYLRAAAASPPAGGK